MQGMHPCFTHPKLNPITCLRRKVGYYPGRSWPITYGQQVDLAGYGHRLLLAPAIIKGEANVGAHHGRVPNVNFMNFTHAWRRSWGASLLPSPRPPRHLRRLQGNKVKRGATCPPDVKLVGERASDEAHTHPAVAVPVHGSRLCFATAALAPMSSPWHLRCSWCDWEQASGGACRGCWCWSRQCFGRFGPTWAGTDWRTLRPAAEAAQNVWNRCMIAYCSLRRNGRNVGEWLASRRRTSASSPMGEAALWAKSGLVHGEGVRLAEMECSLLQRPAGRSWRYWQGDEAGRLQQQRL